MNSMCVNMIDYAISSWAKPSSMVHKISVSLMITMLITPFSYGGQTNYAEDIVKVDVNTLAFDHIQRVPSANLDCTLPFIESILIGTR